MKKKVSGNNMIYYSSKEPFKFNVFKTIRSFGENIYDSKITINEADQERADLLEYILNFNNKARPKNKNEKKNFLNVFNTTKDLYDGRALVIIAFKSGLFKSKSTAGLAIKILTPK